MLKVVFGVLLAGSMLTSQAGVLADDRISIVVKKAFELHFPGAMYAKWESLKEENLFIVRFVHNEIPQIAYYDRYGKVVGVVKNIRVYKLPVMVKKTVTDVFRVDEYANIEELLMNGEKNYLFTVKSGRKTVFVKLNNEGQIDYTQCTEMNKPVPGQ